MTDTKPAEADNVIALAVCVDVDVQVPGALTREGLPFEAPPPFGVCGACGAPAYLCRSAGRGKGCEAVGTLDLGDRLWLCALRLGTLINRKLASGYGGVLILAARAMVGGGAAPSDHIAALLPHPGYHVTRPEALALGVAYLDRGDLTALSRFSASLMTTSDALLWQHCRKAEMPTLSFPWRGARYAGRILSGAATVGADVATEAAAQAARAAWKAIQAAQQAGQHAGDADPAPARTRRHLQQERGGAA
jgi:hypothetical protein